MVQLQFAAREAIEGLFDLTMLSALSESSGIESNCK